MLTDHQVKLLKDTMQMDLEYKNLSREHLTESLCNLIDDFEKINISYGVTT